MDDLLRGLSPPIWNLSGDCGRTDMCVGPVDLDASVHREVSAGRSEFMLAYFLGLVWTVTWKEVRAEAELGAWDDKSYSSWEAWFFEFCCDQVVYNGAPGGSEKAPFAVEKALCCSGDCFPGEGESATIDNGRERPNDDGGGRLARLAGGARLAAEPARTGSGVGPGMTDRRQFGRLKFGAGVTRDTRSFDTRSWNEIGSMKALPVCTDARRSRMAEAFGRGRISGGASARRVTSSD